MCPSESVERIACLTESEILRFFVGRLSDKEHQSIDRHFDSCEKCRQLAESLSGDLATRTTSDGSQFEDPAWDPAESRELGRFQILKRLGVGGFGVVYLANDPMLDRHVAIKIPKEAAFADLKSCLRFFREAKIAAKLDHPNIVPVFEAGRVGDLFYLTSAYCSGPSLAHWHEQSDNQIDPAVAARIVERLARGVAHAHKSSVMHRDIKPVNVLLDLDKPSGDLPFTPMLTDFGLAKLIDEENDMTASGEVLGTPRYMPPEQLSGRREDIGLGADIYALGAVLYELLSGCPPFQASTYAETLRLALHCEPTPPRKLRPQVPADLEAICAKCLEKRPENRYADATQLAEDLRRFEVGDPVRARRVGVLERSWRWCQRRPAAVGSLLGLVATMISLLVLALFMQRLEASREHSRRLEKEAELKQMQLESANQLIHSQREITNTQKYFLELARIRERSTERQVGWAFENLHGLEQIASLDTESVNLLELRNEAARCLTGFDLREVASVPVPIGYEPHLLAFHPDGSRLAIATLGSVTELCVLVCEVPSGRIVHDLRVDVPFGFGFDGIRHLTYLGDGSELAITTRSDWLHRWSLTSNPVERQSIRMPRKAVKPFVFDGPRCRAYFCFEKQLYRWPNLAKPDVELIDDRDASRLHVSRYGRWLAASRKELEVLDSRDGSVQQRIADIPTVLAFHPSNTTIAGIWTPEMVIADVERGTVIRRIRDPSMGQLHEDAVTQVSFSPSGQFVLTSAHDQKFKVWDPNVGQLLLSVMISGADEVRAEFGPREKYVAATGGDRVLLYQVSGGNVLSSLAAQADPIDDFDLSSNPAVAFLVASADDGNAAYSLWDLKENVLLDRWRTAAAPNATQTVAIAERADFLAASNGRDKRIQLWTTDGFPALGDRAEGTVRSDLALSPAIGSRSRKSLEEIKARRVSLLDFARSDSGRLIAAHQQLQVSAWTLPGSQEDWTWSNSSVADLVGMGAVASINAGSDYVAIGVKSKSMLLFNLEHGQPVFDLAVDGRASTVAISPDQRLAACGTEDGLVVIATVPNGDLIAQVQAHRDEVTAVAFAADGQLFASASRDKTICLWKREESGLTQVLRFKLSGSIQAMKFAPVGQQLIASVKGQPALFAWNLNQLDEELTELGLSW